jgi:hypothetical protein
MTDFAIDSSRESAHVCKYCVDVECVNAEVSTGLLIGGFAEISIPSGEFVLWAVDVSFDGRRWEIETEITRNGPDEVVEALSETGEQLEDLKELFDRAMALWAKVGSIDKILGDV